MDIDVNDKSEQRKFGVLVGGAFALLGGVRWYLRAHVHGQAYFPSWLLALAAVLIVLGVAWPRGLRPAFAAWMKLAVVMNWIMTRVFLTVAFYILITPVRYLIRWFGEDPLKRQWQPDAPTYWEAPEEQPGDFNRYRKQY